jgi:hypothetical protein
MATYLPFSDVVAAYGYRQPPPAKQRVNLLMLALAYVVMGGALGTVAGTGVAMATFHTSMPSMVFQVAPPVQASSTVDNTVTAQPSPSALSSKVVSAPSSMRKPSPFKLAKASVQAPHQHTYAIHQSAVLKPVALTAVSTRVSTPDTVTVATPVLPVVTEAAVQNYTFFSEGDATVADFDASMGKIETYEGRTFVLGATAVASAPESLQDSGSSVHYRCDQSGSCTLSRAGQVMQNVRLM